MTELAVGEGTDITLYFSLSLEDGEIIDSNFDSKPATFSFGDGNIMPGFEEKLIGMKAGDENTFLVPPEDGFGQPNPNNVQVVERASFEQDVTLEAGLVVTFADAKGGQIPGVIKSFDDAEVSVDFNHPLAGRSIVFQVKIIDVKPAVTH